MSGETSTRRRTWLAQRRTRLAVLVVAALLLVAGTVAVFATRSDDESRTPSSIPTPTAARASGPNPSGPNPSGQNPSGSSLSEPGTNAPNSSVPGTSGAIPGGTAEAGRPSLPSGWTDYHDPTGFSVYVPKGWTKSQKGSIVYFRGAGRVLGIDQTTHPNMNPVADWRGKADYRVAHGDFPGYHEIRISPVKYFVKAADWEFTFDGSRARQHVNNRGVVVNDHQAYGIYWQTPDSAWASAYPDLQLVFRSLRPRT